MASRDFRPPSSVASSSRKLLVLDVLQERDHFRMRADHVCDVKERQPHSRRDVVGGGLRERVGRVLFAQPRLQLVVQPPRGLHPCHDRPDACGSPRIRLCSSNESARMKSSSAEPDFARMSRFNAAIDASLRSINSATMAGSVSMGRAPRRPAPPGSLVRTRPDEVVRPFEDGLQHVPDQRIGPFPRTSRRPARLDGDARLRATSTNSRPPLSYIGRGVGQLPHARAPGASSGRSSSVDDRRRCRRGTPRR